MPLFLVLLILACTLCRGESPPQRRGVGSIRSISKQEYYLRILDEDKDDEDDEEEEETEGKFVLLSRI